MAPIIGPAPCRAHEGGETSLRSRAQGAQAYCVTIPASVHRALPRWRFLHVLAREARGDCLDLGRAATMRDAGEE